MTAHAVERALPSSPEAEKCVLGSVILNSDLFPDVASAIEPEDFSLEKNRRVFARMKDLYDRGERIDLVCLAEELKRCGQLESIDGLGYLVTLDQDLPALPNIDGYLRIVKDKSILRQTMFACQKIIDQCFLAEEPSEEILDAGGALLDRVRVRSGSTNGDWLTPHEVLARGGMSILFPENGGTGLRTPWAKLTEMTSGWSDGDLIIVAGRPGMGKSVIGMQQAYVTASQGVGAAYISLEMSKESLTRRLIAGISRVDAHRARSGYLVADERKRMLEAAADLETVPLFIDASRAHTLAAAIAALRKLRQQIT